MADYSYLGSGKVSLRIRGAAAPLLMIGNVSALAFNINEDVKTQKDYTQPGGGTYNEVRRIESVEMSLTMNELSPENLARALYGSITAITGAPITAEALGLGYKGGLLKFAKVPAVSPAPVIKAANSVAAV